MSQQVVQVGQSHSTVDVPNLPDAAPPSVLMQTASNSRDTSQQTWVLPLVVLCPLICPSTIVLAPLLQPPAPSLWLAKVAHCQASTLVATRPDGGLERRVQAAPHRPLPLPPQPPRLQLMQMQWWAGGKATGVTGRKHTLSLEYVGALPVHTE